MLVNPEDAQEQEAQKYETMQCFTVSEPKSIKEEGEGEKTWLAKPVPRAVYSARQHESLSFFCFLVHNKS